MPDQYTYAEFQRLELTPGHQPVMAEIDTTSSHTPWVPLPSMVPWNQVGNGSIFDSQRGTAADGGPGLEQHQHRAPVLRPVNPVLNDCPHVMGHRAERPEPRAHPARRPAAAQHRQRPGARQDVPVSIITRSPSVLKQMSSWHWQDGLLPSPALRSRKWTPSAISSSTPSARPPSGKVAGVVDAMDGGEPGAVPLDLVDAGGTEIEPVEGAERGAESPAQHDLYRGYVTDHQDGLAAVTPAAAATGPVTRRKVSAEASPPGGACSGRAARRPRPRCHRCWTSSG